MSDNLVNIKPAVIVLALLAAVLAFTAGVAIAHA